MNSIEFVDDILKAYLSWTTNSRNNLLNQKARSRTS